MKKIVSFLLAVVLLVSAVPMAHATNAADLGTVVSYTAPNDEAWTVTVPAQLAPSGSGTVTLEGKWPSNKTITVVAQKTVTLTNSINSADTKTLNINFDGIEAVGSNTTGQKIERAVSVAAMPADTLFGTWTGHFYYTVSQDSPEYLGTVSADNTITLSGVETAGTYTLRYANADGALDNYADICSLEVTDPATAVSYDDLIAENCAPVEATTIAVYNEADEKVGDIALGSLETNLGTKLYSFGALADIHIGDTGAVEKTSTALQYLTETEGVDFTCIPGDLIENVTEENISTLISTISNASPNTPVYLSAGNHDAKYYNYNNENNIDVETALEQHTGKPLYYSFTHGNDVFIMVGIYGNEENVLFANGELEWLYDTLEANKDKRCFVFQHVRPDIGSGNAGGFYTYDVWSGYDEISFESLMERYTNAIFFHGHSHTIFEGQTIDDIANYDNIRGSHSVHIPSVTKPRALTGSYDLSMSQGMAIDVYENGIVLKGIDFANNQFLPIGQYYLANQVKDDQPSNITIPLNLAYQYGIKLSKTDNSFTEVSYDNSTAHDSYWASQYIPYDNNAIYTVGFAKETSQCVSICYYDNNHNLISYHSNILDGSNGDMSARSVEIPAVNGTAYIRLRTWCWVDPYNPISTTSQRVYIAKQFTAS